MKPLVHVQTIFGQSVWSVHEPALDVALGDGDGDDGEELLAVVGPPLAVPVHVAL